MLYRAHSPLFGLAWVTSIRLLNGSYAFNCSIFQLMCPSLRVKVHVPHEALQTLVTRLRRFHQASDVLRRTSRFVILTRRLQVQMNEIQGIKTSDNGLPDDPATATLAQGKDIADEKERAIAKAALTISELGLSHICTASISV